jgi:hypothetical protein
MAGAVTLALAFAAWNCLGGRGVLPFGRVVFRCLLPALALWLGGSSLPAAAYAAACFLFWLSRPTGPGFACITGRDERRDEWLSRLASRWCGFTELSLNSGEAKRFGAAYLALRGLALAPLFLMLASLTPWALPCGCVACAAEAVAFRLVGLSGEQPESVARADLLAGFLHGAALALTLATL